MDVVVDITGVAADLLPMFAQFINNIAVPPDSYKFWLRGEEIRRAI